MLAVQPHRSNALKQRHQGAIITLVPCRTSLICTYIRRVDIWRFHQLRIYRKWSWSSSTVYVMVSGRVAIGVPSTPFFGTKQRHQGAVNSLVPGRTNLICTYIGRVDIRRFGHLKIDRKCSCLCSTVSVMVPCRVDISSTPLYRDKAAGPRRD
jgi:hypothetical protein